MPPSRRGPWVSRLAAGNCSPPRFCTGPWSAAMAEPKNDPKTSGRFAYDGLERVIHEKARLGILASLIAHPDGVVFNDLKDLCSLTDGNLSRHLQVLPEQHLV